MSRIKGIKLSNNAVYDIRGQVYFGMIDQTSTATVFTSQIPGITDYFDGLTIYIYNGVITSAENNTMNINNLGAKKIYQSSAENTLLTTEWKQNTGYVFIYNSARDNNNGGWDWQAGYGEEYDGTIYELYDGQIEVEEG